VRVDAWTAGKRFAMKKLFTTTKKIHPWAKVPRISNNAHVIGDPFRL
jgi:hypothetical protein